MGRRRIDLFAVWAAGLSLGMLLVYVRLMREQGEGDPAAWAVAILVFGTVAGVYGAVAAAPWRQPVLVLAAVALAALGVLAILTIGMPILAAGALCLIASMRPARAGVVRSGKAPPRASSAS